MRITLFIGLISLMTDSSAQIIDNSLDIYSSYGFTSPIGKKDITEGEFILPSFYNNFKETTSISVGTSLKVKPTLSIGLEYNQLSFTNWPDESSLFTNSTSVINSFGPTIRVHSRFQEKGTSNRFNFFSQISPQIVHIENTFGTNFISSDPPLEIEKIKSNLLSFGIRMTAGMIYSIDQSFGILIRSNIGFKKVKSDLFNDASLLTISNEVGLVIKMKNDKRYYLDK